MDFEFTNRIKCFYFEAFNSFLYGMDPCQLLKALRIPVQFKFMIPLKACCYINNHTTFIFKYDFVSTFVRKMFHNS